MWWDRKMGDGKVRDEVDEGVGVLLCSGENLIERGLYIIVIGL